MCAVGLSCAVCVLAMWLQVWLQDDHDTSRRTRVIPIVDRSNSPFYIVAFGTVEVFIVLSVLVLHVNLIQIGSKPFFCATLLRK